ncbi:hypothetical protein G6L32_26145 [Agrobacterium tumefaciens]|uniref:GMC oxidoreductase n=1 Tax=Agrobacterium TaxID=357 RepID=UPI000FDDEA5F|nr:GMC oxidoreductase [Agrobacterium sp. RS6]NSZ77130.1 hypothetical protein [Agrobacterium tumefaciens]NTA13564.1 hypothetical protein [Agrobacterium tumefaciens]NTA62109.1 hypothetical protein [Agrobacterium tumefaciens]NTZ63737.1 hypothetical protein [Agrobacterium tumefaciens]UXR95004.1 hypothetical protein FY157_25140 [Agrobacterium tumefaciens]
MTAFIRSVWPGWPHQSTQGVVDADCKVHGFSYLYVAGSCVFPTGGHANPTLPAVALAMRLADHLAGKYGRR